MYFIEFNWIHAWTRTRLFLFAFLKDVNQCWELERRQRKAFRILSFSSKQEQDLQNGSSQNVPAPQHCSWHHKNLLSFRPIVTRPLLMVSSWNESCSIWPRQTSRTSAAGRAAISAARPLRAATLLVSTFILANLPGVAWTKVMVCILVINLKMLTLPLYG